MASEGTSRGAENSRSFPSLAPNHGVNSEMELDVHKLELFAFGAVLNALMAQSDELTWEKEVVITDLRKTLRVSNEEHRQLLKTISSEQFRVVGNLGEAVQRIITGSGNAVAALSPPVRPHSTAVGVQPLKTSSLKRGCPSGICFPRTDDDDDVQLLSHKDGPSGVGLQNVANQVASSEISAFGTPSSSLGRGTPGFFAPRTNVVQPTFAPSKPSHYVPPKDLMDDSSKNNKDPAIGMRVMIRSPVDGRFREAVVTDYNPANGQHSLMYNIYTPKATVEWVDMKEISAENIKWMGVYKKTSRFESGETSKRGRPRGRPPSSKSANGRVKPSSVNESADIYRGGLRQHPDSIMIYSTDSLIKKVEKMLETEFEQSQLDRAKEIIKEQEEALVHAIERLKDSDSYDDDEGPPENEPE